MLKFTLGNYQTKLGRGPGGPAAPEGSGEVLGIRSKFGVLKFEGLVSVKASVNCKGFC